MTTVVSVFMTSIMTYDKYQYQYDSVRVFFAGFSQIWNVVVALV